MPFFLKRLRLFDRAMGEGAETCAEAAEIMTPESDPNNIVDLESDTQVAKASSLEHFINSTTQKLDPTEVHNEVIAIPDLSPDEQLKACSWFIENEKQFLMLKTIPTERKKGMVFMFISPKAYTFYIQLTFLIFAILLKHWLE
ncbi:hypothetical protein L3X38_006471 [Prunus dulcis]|uniref:Uncharacterized protein n=1 Tax=Prunus dulcis TaxID=3755 RepID=A0AAD4ZSZ2_PRUDU|nr:hypothetical protein L3X38_006471 [Prunus dulcis]